MYPHTDRSCPFCADCHCSFSVPVDTGHILRTISGSPWQSPFGWRSDGRPGYGWSVEVDNDDVSEFNEDDKFDVPRWLISFDLHHFAPAFR